MSKVTTAALGLLTGFGFASGASAQQVEIYCDCGAGLGPCGNGVDSNVPGGCLNSLGGKAFFFYNGGSLSIGADDLILGAGNLPNFQFGLVYMGPNQTQIPFGDGLRCVAGGNIGLFRFPVQDIANTGQLVLGPGIVAHSHANFAPTGHIQAGQTWNFQGWYRDPGGPCGSGFNLTNGLRVTFTP